MTEKSQLHPKNIHRSGYDFVQLCKSLPALKPFVVKNPHQQLSIDFSNPDAVKKLNHALLQHHYKLTYWDIPKGYLCPPIPGRVDYIHYLADLLHSSVQLNESQKQPIKVLDIGTGGSCIYPILGHTCYGWDFVASDIDPVSIKFANNIVKQNAHLSQHIKCRLQTNAKQIFNGIIKQGEQYDLTLCNPPFHDSLENAHQGSQRKWQNLGRKSLSQPKHQQNTQPVLNFGGQKAELWCKGGERAFIKQMINESKYYAKQVRWFTCLVSKKDNLSAIKLAFKKAKVKETRIVKMAQGQKVSRFVAWSYD